MQRFSSNRILLFLIIISFFFVSCSRKVTKLQHVQPDTYLSPKYEDVSFTNVSMDICYPILDFDIPPAGADTVHINNMKEFDVAFKNYFLDGIKLFSSITKAGWIFFKPDYDIHKESVEYWTTTEDGSDFYVLIDSSLAFFREQSNSDFLMTFQLISYSKIPADSANPNSKYESVIDIHYLIWERKTGDLIAMDKVNAKIEFNRIVGKWPYRSAIMKSAALIFDKLPMFQK